MQLEKNRTSEMTISVFRKLPSRTDPRYAVTERKLGDCKSESDGFLEHDGDVPSTLDARGEPVSLR